MEWGLLGGENIANISLAPELWTELFRTSGIETKHFCVNTDSPSEIKKFILSVRSNDSIKGFNIARPWKGVAFKCCDEVEDVAKNMGTVNTIVKENGKLKGYNTDGPGIVKAILKRIDLKNKKILVLGCGGAAQTVPYYLWKEGVAKIFLTDISQSKVNTLVKKYTDFYPDIELNPIKRTKLCECICDCDIIINATPCGMKDNDELYPFDIDYLYLAEKLPVIVEMVYSPSLTPLLQHAHINGNTIISGISMLVEQAIESSRLAYGVKVYHSNLLGKKCLERMKQ